MNRMNHEIWWDFGVTKNLDGAILLLRFFPASWCCSFSGWIEKATCGKRCTCKAKRGSKSPVKELEEKLSKALGRKIKKGDMVWTYQAQLSLLAFFVSNSGILPLCMLACVDFCCFCIGRGFRGVAMLERFLIILGGRTRHLRCCQRWWVQKDQIAKGFNGFGWERSWLQPVVSMEMQQTLPSAFDSKIFVDALPCMAPPKLPYFNVFLARRGKRPLPYWKLWISRNWQKKQEQPEQLQKRPRNQSGPKRLIRVIVQCQSPGIYWYIWYSLLSWWISHIGSSQWVAAGLLSFPLSWWQFFGLTDSVFILRKDGGWLGAAGTLCKWITDQCAVLELEWDTIPVPTCTKHF